MHYLPQAILISFQGTKHIKPNEIKAIVEPASLNWSEKIGDWYLLNLVLKNMDPVAVDQLIGEMIRNKSIRKEKDINEKTEEKEV